MKKISILIVCIIAPFCANAIQMCAHSNTYVITMLRSRDGVSSTADTNGTWTVTFDYSLTSQNAKTMTGRGACNEITGTVNTGDSSVSPTLTDTGKNCWCMMKFPVVSDWIFINEYSTESECAQSCTALCADNAKTSTAFRTVMYENIW